MPQENVHLDVAKLPFQMPCPRKLIAGAHELGLDTSRVEPYVEKPDTRPADADAMALQRAINRRTR
ncbi:MAG: hypothetical protein KBD16_02235 [Candidatus Pacebacteria bacterium]|nr:hypothetical protein [Candidatus Paceibacterota bacterium]